MPITHEPFVIGLLMSLPALVFSLERTRVGKAIFQFLPPLLFCYFLPSILQITRVIDADKTPYYAVATQYFLPASLLLFGLSFDVRALLKVGKTAIAVFLAGVLGIIIGAPIALALVGSFFPSVLAGQGGEEVWRGLATIAGTWIGGAANQAAIKLHFQTDEGLFAIMGVIDVLVAYLWMAILLFGAKIHPRLDARLRADNTILQEVERNLADYQAQVRQPATVESNLALLAFALGGVGIAQYAAHTWQLIPIWVSLLCTAMGILLSFLPAARRLEGAGASQWASALLYCLITALGTKLNLLGVDKMPLLLLIAVIWIAIHALCLWLVARWLRAPFFFVAVGSQAAIGGVASAPIVASAFQPSLASVGVLLAVFGYAIGTGGALICAYLMQAVFLHLR